jgi:hypothetical protein
MDELKTSWNVGFKEKIRDKDKNEYWLKELPKEGMEGDSQTDSQTENVKGVLDLMEIERLKTIKQMEMENFKHVELLQNISDLRENMESVIEGGYHKKPVPNAASAAIPQDSENGHKWYDDHFDGDGDDGDDGNDGDHFDIDGDGGDDGDGYDTDGQENFVEGMKKCKVKKPKIGKIFDTPFFRKIGKLIKYLVSFLDMNSKQLTRLYVRIANGIADVLSGDTATKSDKKFIYVYLCYFVVIVMSIFVFMDFYYVFAFDETWKETETYKDKKDVLNEKFKGNSFFDTVIGVALDSFIFMITTFHWLFSYVPVNYLGFRNSTVIPYLFLFVFSFVSKIHTGLITFLKSLFLVDIKKISKNTSFIFITLSCLFFAFKFIGVFLYNHQNFIPKDMITGLFFLFIVTIFLILIMMTQPILAYMICTFYFLYYAFIPILFHGDGFVDNMKKVYESLTTLNYEYKPELDKNNCLPGMHECNDPGVIGWIMSYFIEPSHLFICRHFLTFIFSFYLWKMMFDAFLYIKSFQLKIILIFICLTVSFLLMLGGDWFTAMEIRYVGGKGFYSSYFHLGLLPLFGVLYYVYQHITKKWVNTPNKWVDTSSIEKSRPKKSTKKVQKSRPKKSAKKVQKSRPKKSAK